MKIKVKNAKRPPGVKKSEREESNQGSKSPGQQRRRIYTRRSARPELFFPLPFPQNGYKVARARWLVLYFLFLVLFIINVREE